MKVTTVTYRRIKNLGNYQSETVELTAEVEQGEDYKEVFDKLRQTALEKLEYGREF